VNKAQFIEALAARLDTDRRAAQTYLDAVFDQIYATVSKGEEVVLTGFGKFEKRDRAARTARNPATGAPVRVKKTSVPGFKAGTEFKAIVSGAKKVAKAPAKKAAKTTTARKTTTAAAKKAAPAKKAANAAPAAAKKTAPAKAAASAE
jgi:DNA-binding protein HU-beta